MKDHKDFLYNLLNAYSPSGCETEALNVWDAFCLAQNFQPYYQDKIGNHAYSLGHGPVKILLSGHIDEVNARVINISKTGMISMVNTGGMDRKSLIASEVVILGDNGPVRGIVGKRPIHLESAKERDAMEDFENLRIDVGASSDDEVRQMGIYEGCIIVYRRNVNLDFGQYGICSNSLDDKIAVYITAMILLQLQKFQSQWDKQYTVIGMAAAQEETGCRGAQVAAKNINPDISIDFDVTFSTDGDLGIKHEKQGSVVLGKGGVIMYGPDKSIRIASILKDVCREHQIPFQSTAGRAGGTNTNQIQLMSADCETMLVSVPNRNMHTPVEVCDWRDVESIITMITSAITEQRL